ncbi:hypothetical protein [Rhodococcus tibetensis]|uniref:DUF3263 domain-containing protein n=1 Tax=Rhodococcus tibetensis TaxID=2965064 RepID=A0ABT1QG61_9NOCA|nr:hypothetical protein [Rhodococcus sp. FXJ9.536]MCQ4120750.1 hypothetical protein [Rhodococcus sp. FXJ9.536]
MLETTAAPSTTSTVPVAGSDVPCRAHTTRGRIGDREARRVPVRADTTQRSRDLDWVRHCLRVCDLLTNVQSLSQSDRALVAFAIEWAPYGGADAEELFIKFGVHRNRFLSMLQAAMIPRRSDLKRLCAVKATLGTDILRAWQRDHR